MYVYIYYNILYIYVCIYIYIYNTDIHTYPTDPEDQKKGYLGFPKSVSTSVNDVIARSTRNEALS